MPKWRTIRAKPSAARHVLAIFIFAFMVPSRSPQLRPCPNFNTSHNNWRETRHWFKDPNLASFSCPSNGLGMCITWETHQDCLCVAKKSRETHKSNGKNTWGPRGVTESSRSHECGNRWAELGNMQGSGNHARVSGAFFGAVKRNCGSVKWNWNSGEKNWGGARALETCQKDRENNLQI